MRFVQSLGTAANGELVYEVRPSSRDCKFREQESFLALQDENIAGFLDLRVRDLLDGAALQQVPIQDRNRRKADIFSGALVAFDRTALTAQVTLSTFRGADNIRGALVNSGVVDISTDLTDFLYQSVREYNLTLKSQDFLYQFQSESPAGNNPTRSHEAAICRANSFGVL